MVWQSLFSDKKLGSRQTHPFLKSQSIRLEHPSNSVFFRKTFSMLFVIDIATQRVEIAGVTENPDEAFMLQCARQLTDPMEGFLKDKCYLNIFRCNGM